MKPGARAIAIVGLAGRFPKAPTLDVFWKQIREGAEILETFSDADLDAANVGQLLRANPRYVRKGTPIENPDWFDAAFFGYSPREAQTIDPQQRMFLECAHEALEHAGYGAVPAGVSVGVYAGSSMNTYLMNELLRDRDLLMAAGAYQIMLGSDKDFLCTRVAYELDLHGPAVSVQTACSTSLVAVQMACRALQRGECHMALAGGVSLTFPERRGYLYEEGMIHSPDGHCRPFDARARGTRTGNGAGVVLLRPLEDALKARDTIHAVILGAATNNDGSAKAGFTAPSVDGQATVVRMALDEAGVTARSISYVEAHGTATPIGDPIEVAALTRAFRADTSDIGYCRLGAVKANIGHLDAAAGVAGLIKTVLALRHAELPPLVNFESPNPQLELAQSPFVADSTAAPWTAGDVPRRAAVSSFGIGGTNAHVILEEPPAVEKREDESRAELIVLSARSRAALDEGTARLVRHLRESAQPMADIAFTLQAGRRSFEERRYAVVKDRADAIELFAAPNRAPVVTMQYSGRARPVAFLFSGQGSQHPLMGRGLYRTEPVFRDAFDRCASLLQPMLGADIRDLVFGDDAQRAVLDETRITQPALFAVEYALGSLWQSWGVVPAAMLGHSIGEYVAAHFASVFSLDDALRIVSARGRLMQALPPGAMLSVHLAPGDVQQWLGGGVELAGVSASVCTVAGPIDAIASLAERLAGAGIESRPVRTSHAFHSAMMEPALAPFEHEVSAVRLSKPKIPFVSNVTGTWITDELATSPRYYADHARRAVQFDAGVRMLAAAPDTLLLEVGPGTALTTLARLSLSRADARRVVSSLAHPRDARDEREAMLDAAGRLWASGVTIDWVGMHSRESRRRVPIPTYAFDRKPFRTERGNQPVQSAGVPVRSDDVADWFYAPTWMRRSASGQVAPLRDTWLVIGGENVLASAVADGIAKDGATPRRVGSQENVRDVVRDLYRSGVHIAGAIHLSATEADATDHAAYHSLIELASALEGVSSERPFTLIAGTVGAQSVMDEPVERVGASLVTGPVLILPVELAGLHARAVDLPAADVNSAALLLAEARVRDGERFVAWRNGRRWVRRAEQLRLPAPDSTMLRDRGVYVITGGLGGIGAALAMWLSRTKQARLLLTTRATMPESDAWDAWLRDHAPDDRIAKAIVAVREMEAAGGDVIVATADVGDVGAMQHALDLANAKWGDTPVNGVIHAAGIVREGLSMLRSRAEADAVLAPKVDGLRAILRVFGDSDLDFVALCSSFNALSGGPGIADYSSANAYLDAFAESSTRPRRWKRVVAIDWWTWSEVGMALAVTVPEAMRAMRAAFLRAGIPTQAGVDAFARVLASDEPRVVVSPFDFTHPLFLGAAREGSGQTAAPEPSRAAPPPLNQPRPNLDIAYEAPVTPFEEKMQAIWVQLLGIDQIGVNDDFFALGGHSLLATRLIARIEEVFGISLAVGAVFDAPTIRRLAQVVEHHDSAAVLSAKQDVAGDREEIEF